jgi:hypothetical protein
MTVVATLLAEGACRPGETLQLSVLFAVKPADNPGREPADFFQASFFSFRGVLKPPALMQDQLTSRSERGRVGFRHIGGSSLRFPFYQLQSCCGARCKGSGGQCSFERWDFLCARLLSWSLLSPETNRY